MIASLLKRTDGTYYCSNCTMRQPCLRPTCWYCECEFLNFITEKYNSEEKTMNLKDIYEEYLDYLTNMPDEKLKELYENAMKNSPIIEFPPEIVYCRDCIHRPVYDEEENDLIVPPYNNEHQDCACPYICQEDFYLNRMPDKDFYCKFGERKNEI